MSVGLADLYRIQDRAENARINGYTCIFSPAEGGQLAGQLLKVLDIHRPAPGGVCAAEPHVIYPCPTARAALGIR